MEALYVAMVYVPNSYQLQMSKPDERTGKRVDKNTPSPPGYLYQPEADAFSSSQNVR
jgi:hypothetical protein